MNMPAVVVPFWFSHIFPLNRGTVYNCAVDVFCGEFVDLEMPLSKTHHVYEISSVMATEKSTFSNTLSTNRLGLLDYSCPKDFSNKAEARTSLDAAAKPLGFQVFISSPCMEYR